VTSPVGWRTLLAREDNAYPGEQNDHDQRRL
jgi:hypothetical protein